MESSTLRYKTPTGTREKLRVGQLYHVTWPMGPMDNTIRERVFIFVGETYRRRRSARGISKGRPKWFLDIELVTDNRKKPTTLNPSGLARKKAQEKAVFTPLTNMDLPCYIYLPNKYPAWDRLFSKELTDDLSKNNG